LLQRQKNANNVSGEESRGAQISEDDIPLLQDELDNVTTIMYILIESARNDAVRLAATYKELGKCHVIIKSKFLANPYIALLDPRLVDYFLTAVAKLRWDDANELPQTRVNFHNQIRVEPS
jgi:hypothetical protein